MNIVKTTKLFYGEYPYKITFKRLYGFPNKNLIQKAFPSNLLGEDKWWFDFPQEDSDRQRRTNCFQYLKSLEGTKFNNGANTHVYFLDRKTFELALSRYPDLQKEANEPLIDNIVSVLNSYDERIAVRKTLYFKKHRYKVVFRGNIHFFDHNGPHLWEMYKDNPNYQLNSNMRKFDKLKFTGRHSPYNLYAIYCREKIDLELVSFVSSESISTITKAVLLHEIDK